MPKAFPYTKYHFGVYFLFPKFNFDTGFQSVEGLSFTMGGEGSSRMEGGNNGFSLPLTGRGSFGTLTLTRGFTADRKLYEWCEGTNMTMKTQPCNILISALDNSGDPVRNWLVFNAFPKGWNAGGFNATDQNSVMIESVSLAYQNFLLI